jgi:hypothetical protein
MALKARDVVLLDQLGGIHLEGLGQLTDGAPLRFYPARLKVEDGCRTHTGPLL